MLNIVRMHAESRLSLLFLLLFAWSILLWELLLLLGFRLQRSFDRGTHRRVYSCTMYRIFQPGCRTGRSRSRKWPRLCTPLIAAKLTYTADTSCFRFLVSLWHSDFQKYVFLFGWDIIVNDLAQIAEILTIVLVLLQLRCCNDDRVWDERLREVTVSEGVELATLCRSFSNRVWRFGVSLHDVRGFERGLGLWQNLERLTPDQFFLRLFGHILEQFQLQLCFK